MERTVATELRPPESCRERRTLRVCHLAYSFYETDNRVRRYASALTGRGDEVDVFALRREGQPRLDQIDGARVFRIQGRSKTERARLVYLLKIVCFIINAAVVISFRHMWRPYDIAHVHNVPDFLVFALTVPRLFGCRVILDIHDALPELYVGKFIEHQPSAMFRALALLEKLSCRFAHHVVVANHIWRERIVARSSAPAMCTTILNYPDLSVFQPRPSVSLQPPQPFVMLYPGSLSRHQGVDVAITAFAHARDRMPTAELHIYGEGPAKGELQQFARRLGLNGEVKFFDPLPLDQIALVMVRSAVGVEPKQAKGFSDEALSTKILEFMACGVPVVASSTRAHTHYFNDRVLTFFPPGDSARLSEAMVDLYEDYPRFRDSIAQAKELSASYAWQARAGEYFRIVDAIAN